jgi:tRNA threonylcarbamoyladenosine biosynthesis protein TsaB
VADVNVRKDFGASSLLLYIDKYLKKLSLKLNMFDAFVVGKGPGSFTGLRISYSIVKALSIALKKPVITIGSFMSLAYPFRKKEAGIAVIADARRNLIYAASFMAKNGRLIAEGKERLIRLEEYLNEKHDYLFITYDDNLRKEALRQKLAIAFYPKNVWPRASYLLAQASFYYTKGIFTSPGKLEPLFLHPKTCQIRMKT